jgi:serine/threonine protein kinase
MFCSRCGSEITGKSKFCPSCGLDLTAATPVHAIATGALQEMDLVREALSAEYEILEELGRGGMALVYRARDRQLEREVAVKVLPFSLAFDAEFVERFQREARTAAQLEHPNIIPIYRVGRAGRVIYFVMKYLRGGSLSTILGERAKLAPPEIRRLLVEAGSALGYAAQRGIVHRDIKPDNIMFDEFGQCVLTDFGIAKAASGQRLTGTGTSIGTPHYMSPEQARAQGTDGRSDLYSLGVVAYQCLTGTVPYDGEDSFSIGYKHISEPVPTPALVTADERRLFEIVKRMLMKEPADRFQSCEELLAALQGQPIAAAGSLAGLAAQAMRVSLQASPIGVGAAGAGASASPVAGNFGAGGSPPSIVSRPTTPLTSPLVDRRITPLERRDGPTRRLADRSVAMRSGGTWGWLWVVLAVLGGVGGALYYYKSRGFAPGTAVADSVTPPLQEASRIDTAAVRSAAASTPAVPAPAPTPVAPSPAEPAIDTGSTPVSQRSESSATPATPTPAATSRDDSGSGNRRSATGERTADHCLPGPKYRASRVCFDERPKPINAPFVSVPPDTQVSPTPSLLWVKVSAEGRTVDVLRLQPSNDRAFEREARGFVWTMNWHPALKDGAPVEAWTQMEFRPPPLRQ